MTTVDLLIFTIALLGVVLGLVNLWYSREARRVRLRVIPKLAYDVEGGRYTTSEWNKYAQRLQDDSAAKRWTIEVINLSSFGLTIDEVGFSDQTVDGTFAMMNPEISRKRTWPVRLRPHEKAIFYSTDGVLLPPPVWANPYAYVKTDCGQCVYGKSPVLEHVAAHKALQS
jgi:hypothetical protein